MNSTPLLRGSNITKRFGGLTALNDVNIQIGTDEICGLIGPNGAGKTTVFNIISGRLSPSSGKIEFEGNDMTGKSQHAMCKAGVARSFQTPRPFDSMTVQENVLVGQYFGNNQASTERVNETLELMNLNQYSEDSPSNLTMAQRKRLDLCRALSTDPSLLLLDEIMAGLNPSETQAFVEIIRDISDNRGVIVIEHDMEAVMEVSDRIVVLNSGEKIADGPPEEISSNEQVVEAYLGDEVTGGER